MIYKKRVNSLKQLFALLRNPGGQGHRMPALKCIRKEKQIINSKTEKQMQQIKHANILHRLYASIGCLLSGLPAGLIPLNSRTQIPKGIYQFQERHGHHSGRKH